MKLAILMANTDVSAFSDRHPKDGEKFSDFIKCVRPDWSCSIYNVTQNVFPVDITTYDGVIITGSPASVHDNENWMSKLSDIIVTLHNNECPVFGACFGHQAIAKALGGEVARNPHGWVLGVAHSEGVSDEPNNCPNAGFVIDNLVYTTQYHPEMTPHFISALTEHLAESMDEEIIRKAQDSLSTRVEMPLFAESVAKFFEVPTQ